MSDPIRAALERLIAALGDYEPIWGGFPESALAAARAALAEQQGEGPSDKELNILWNCSGIADEHGNHTGNIFEFARAVLARWGQQPAPPAEGEVAEFITQLKSYAEYGTPIRLIPFVTDRAAELLQQQEAKIESLEQQLETERMRVVACGIIAMSDTPFSAAKNRNCHPDYWSASADDIARQVDELMRLRAQQTPVPVNERLPGPGDRNTEGKCWWFCTAYPGDWPHWILGNEAFCDPTHWLPAHALPLPQGEVEP